MQGAGCHISDSQGQILALAFRRMSLTSLRLFPSRSEVERRKAREEKARLDADVAARKVPPQGQIDYKTVKAR